MILKPDLTKKQGELLHAFMNTNINEILFGGGGRGGKTRGVAEIVNATCLSSPGIARLVGRYDRGDLLKTSFTTLMKVLNAHKLKKDVHYKINMQLFILEYYNGSKIYFSPLRDVPSDPEFNWLGGYEITYARVDEAQEVNRKAVNVIKSRFTEKIAEYDLTGKVVMTCNPDKGHLYSDFIKPSKDGTLIPERVFIQSLYKDNPYIDHTKYEKSLETADRVTKERILHGNWDYDNTPGRLFDYDSIIGLTTNPIINGKKYISCDVARFGIDKSIIRVRDGLEEIKKVTYDVNDIVMLQNKIKELSSQYQIPMKNVVVDEDGVGGGLVDNLRCKGFVNNSSPIDTRTSQQKYNNEHKPNYQNLKTQCYFMLSQYVNDGKIRLSELSDNLKQELDNIVQTNIDKDRPLQIISKEELKRKIGRSTDEADSLMMRMYFELQPTLDISSFIQ